MEDRKIGSSMKGSVFFLLLVLFQILGGKYIIKPLVIPVIKSFGGGLGSLLVISQLVLLILPIVIYFLITKENVKKSLRFNKPYLSEILICMVIGVLAQFVAIFCANLSSFIFKTNEVEEVFKILKNNSYISLLSIIAFTPAICEELAMRGVVLHSYDHKAPWKACVISGVMFGMLHLTGSQFLYASLLGVLLAYLVRITNSIFTSMTVHFIFNGFNVSMAYLLGKLEFISKTIDTAAKKQENLTIANKLQALGITFILAVIAASIIIVLVKSIKDKRDSLGSNTFNNDNIQSNENDRMINIPFIIVVIFYIFYMWNNYF